MKNPRAEELREEICETRQTLRRLQEELDRTLSRPPAPPVGSVVTWKVQYAFGDTVYMYGAVQFKRGQWADTGADSSRMTWDQLLDCVEKDCHVKEGMRRPQLMLWEPGKASREVIW
jgi:hypothetical protein